MCSYTICLCEKVWLDRGWICPVLRKNDPQVQVGEKIKFRRPSRVWSGRHGEKDSRLLGGHGWHKNKIYEILAINRTTVFTQVLVYDDEVGVGWVNVWRKYRSGSTAVWADKIPDWINARGFA